MWAAVLDPERKEVVEVDASASVEGNIGGAKRRDMVPEACFDGSTGVGEPGHVGRRSSRNLGDPAFSGAAGTAEQARASKAGELEVGVPQYERRRGGTEPREPAEQRAAPGHGTVGGKDEGEIELQHRLNETRTASEAGTAYARQTAHDAGASHRPVMAARGVPTHARTVQRASTGRPRSSTQQIW